MTGTVRSGRVALLTMTCLGQFMALLDSTIVGAALPNIQQNLDITLTGLQWIVDAYVMLAAMLLLTGGVLADRFGRKRVFLLGVGVFTAASLLCALAPSLEWLIVGRALQGIGGATLSPASLALLASAYPVAQERIRAIGLWAGFSGIGLAAGPVVGGVLVDLSDWRAIFLVNVPIGVMLLLVGARILTESRNPSVARFDIPGQVLSVLGVGALTFALIEGADLGWASPIILGSFAAAVVLLGAFLAVEARTRAPMVPLRLFGNRPFAVSNTAMVVVGFGLMGSGFFFSQFFVFVQGTSVLRAGVENLPCTIAMVVVSPFAARIAARFGFRTVVTAGSALAGAGLLAWGAVRHDTPYTDMWWRLLIIGIGFGLTMSPLTGAAISSVSPHEGGLASGISNTTRQIGAVLGVAILGTTVRIRQDHGATLEVGLQTAFLTAGLITIVSAAFTALLLAPRATTTTNERHPSEQTPAQTGT
ncbi:DHA2 family efflux MFS transporter permease subunit [Nocardia sp. NPDC004068]|uniref:DHA2 family efflux MFS transporter permease subunit n=1 Tax=Nocardia sp. NPDC004068 TaxID=3364303 RepID=UPI0036CDCF08